MAPDPMARTSAEGAGRVGCSSISRKVIEASGKAYLLLIRERRRAAQSHVSTVNNGCAWLPARGLHHLRYRDVFAYRRRSAAIQGLGGPLTRIGGSVSNSANVGS